MWFTPETIARLQRDADPTFADHLRKQKAAEKAVDEAGLGVCGACAEEIVKNTTLGHWESDFLLGYCYQASDRRHKPLVRYTPENGTANAERNVQAHTEPLPDEGQRD